MFTYPITYFENMKMAGYIRLKLCVHVVVVYADMQFRKIKIEYLRKNEKDGKAKPA